MRLKEIRALVESTGDAALAVDGLGLIVAWNSAAAALFGVTAGEDRDVVAMSVCHR